MVSTVITTAVSELNSAALGASFAVISMLVLVVLLVQKEILSTASDRRLRYLSRAMNVGILPLTMVFVVIVFFKIVEALN